MTVQTQPGTTTTNIDDGCINLLKPKVVFVLGGPGAGKGTQCKNIVDNLGFHHISAGDCLREEQTREGSENGELIRDCIRNGIIVPVEVTCQLLKNKMKSLGWWNQKFLIDGFPRNENNLNGWLKMMGEDSDLLFCLFLDCSEGDMEKRLIQRSATSGREDDNDASIRKRFRTYQEETMPIIQKFESVGQCRKIDAGGPVDQVWAEVRQCMEQC